MAKNPFMQRPSTPEEWAKFIEKKRFSSADIFSLVAIVFDHIAPLTDDEKFISVLSESYEELAAAKESGEYDKVIQTMQQENS